MRKCLWLVVILLQLCCLNIQAQKIHAFVFADTENASIGQANEACVSLMTKFLEDVERESRISLNLKVFTSTRNNSRSTVKDVLDNLSCSNQDVIIFYYSGLGCRAENDKSEFPQLCFNSIAENDYIQSETLWSQLIDKGAHMVLFISDACNCIQPKVSCKEVVAPKLSIEAEPLRIPEGISKAGLLYYQNAHIFFSASKRYSVAYSIKDGGVFTLAFLESYYRYTESNKTDLNWRELLDAIQSSPILSSFQQAPSFQLLEK